MAALLIAMSIMAIMLTVAMPVWKQATQREKEEELVFRGMQYTHAIGLFQRKYANAFPPNFDVLVTERFLRKKYKDPITNDDFVPILQGQGTPGITAPAGAPQQPGRSNAGTSTPGQTTTGPVAGGAQVGGRGAPGGGAVGGIMGVTSKSKDKSIRVYNGRSHYNEWQFIYLAQTQAPAVGGAPGAGVPGAGGGRRGAPGTTGGGFGGSGRPSGPGSGGLGTGRPPGPGTNGRPTGPGQGTPPRRPGG